MNDNKVYYDFLDNLRDSGIVNMFGARPHLMSAFPELSREEAGVILTSWMEQY